MVFQKFKKLLSASISQGLFTTQISARADFRPGLSSALSVVNFLYAFTTLGRAETSARAEFSPVNLTGLRFHPGLRLCLNELKNC